MQYRFATDYFLNIILEIWVTTYCRYHNKLRLKTINNEYVKYLIKYY